MQRFELELASSPPGVGFELPFDPREHFGRVRAPVRVTINGHSFTATAAAMHGRVLVGLNAEVRPAGGRVPVELELDREPRSIELPADLAAGLSPAARGYDESLSFTHREEYVRSIEGAETRRLGIERAAMLGDRVGDR